MFFIAIWGLIELLAIENPTEADSGFVRQLQNSKLLHFIFISDIFNVIYIMNSIVWN